MIKCVVTEKKICANVAMKKVKAFSVAITVDGVAPMLSGIDVVRLAVKKKHDRQQR